MSEVIIVLPEVSTNRISEDLRTLTRSLIEDHNADPTGGGLGGEYGYGTRFTNDTFEMMPYYWGDCTCTRDEDEGEWCDNHDHTPACYQQVIRARGYLDYDDGAEMGYRARDAHNKAITDTVCAEMGLDPEYGCAVHCTCGHDADYRNWIEAHPHDDSVCDMDRPNFRHKPSGAVVNWYKFLGRSMKVDLNGAEWDTIITDCHRSLAPLP